ncbi:MAG: conjugal transfer protein TraD [Gammaproteobacteria bacterium]
MERANDTRQKIQWGGLVKKAGLDQESMEVIYGLLLEAAEKLQSKEADMLRAAWHLKGEQQHTEVGMMGSYSKLMATPLDHIN